MDDTHCVLNTRPPRPRRAGTLGPGLSPAPAARFPTGCRAALHALTPSRSYRLIHCEPLTTLAYPVHDNPRLDCSLGSPARAVWPVSYHFSPADGSSKFAREQRDPKSQFHLSAGAATHRAARKETFPPVAQPAALAVRTFPSEGAIICQIRTNQCPCGQTRRRLAS